MNLKEGVDSLLSAQPSSESEARKLLIAINRLEKEMSEDVKKDIEPYYVEIERARGRYKKEHAALYQKRTHVRQDLINFIEGSDV